MVCFENAVIITPEELKEIIEEEMTNPTLERLMFLETKAKNDIPGKVFPCWVEAWGEDEDAAVKNDPHLKFWICIAQYTGGEFKLARVIIPASDLGTKVRIWDRPPTKGQKEYGMIRHQSKLLFSDI